MFLNIYYDLKILFKLDYTINLVIWILLHRIKSLINYFNPYCSLIVICVGYILFSIYLLFYKDFNLMEFILLLFVLFTTTLHVIN